MGSYGILKFPYQDHRNFALENLECPDTAFHRAEWYNKKWHWNWSNLLWSLHSLCFNSLSTKTIPKIDHILYLTQSETTSHQIFKGLHLSVNIFRRKNICISGLLPQSSRIFRMPYSCQPNKCQNPCEETCLVDYVTVYSVVQQCILNLLYCSSKIFARFLR